MTGTKEGQQWHRGTWKYARGHLDMRLKGTGVREVQEGTNVVVRGKDGHGIRRRGMEGPGEIEMEVWRPGRWGRAW